MKSYRRRPLVRRDANHGLIVQVFESHGVLVLDLAGVGGGAPDLLVYHRGVGEPGRWALVEVKDGAKKWKRHNPAVLARQAAFRDRGWPVFTVEDVDDAKLVALGLRGTGRA